MDVFVFIPLAYQLKAHTLCNLNSLEETAGKSKQTGVKDLNTPQICSLQHGNKDGTNLVHRTIFQDCSIIDILVKLVIIPQSKYFLFFTVAVDVESSLLKCWPNKYHSHHTIFILFRLHFSQQCVCVYRLCDASDLPPCYQQRFLSFQEFQVRLTPEPTGICLWLVHKTYFVEMFTPGTYNN